jgi:hypothetical protein
MRMTAIDYDILAARKRTTYFLDSLYFRFLFSELCWEGSTGIRFKLSYASRDGN